MEQLPKIVQRGLRGSAKPGAHPDPDLLAAFAEKSLNDRERAPVLQHLGVCADCREVLSLSMPEVESAPLPIANRSQWLSWPVLRWGALAACVVVVSAAVTLHLGRRQFAEPPAAQTAPAAPESATLASKVSPQPGQKLAASGPPPAPFPDRDFESADKAARQRQKNGDAGITARASVPLELDQSKEVQELISKSLATSEAKSVAKLPAPVASPAPAAPAPSRAMESLSPKSQTTTRTDAVDQAAKANTQTVMAEIARGPMQETAGKAKDESSRNELHKKIQAAPAGAPAVGSLADRKTDTLSAENVQGAAPEYARLPSSSTYVATRWTLSADGVLQRSFDGGTTWQTIPVAGNIVFRALAANGLDLWVGGAAGALYHSLDGGQHWKQVKPVAGGRSLTADIVTVDFSDAQHGKLTTSKPETWITSDGGATWHR
jgi:hypothetical protein